MEFSGRSAFREPSQFLCFGTKMLRVQTLQGSLCYNSKVVAIL